MDGFSKGHTVDIDGSSAPAANGNCITFSDPNVFRGSHVGDSALRRLGEILGDRPCTTEYFDLSREVDHLDVFISHNWSTPRRDKFLVLALHFNCRAAMLCSVLVSLGVLCLEVVGVLPFMYFSEGGVRDMAAYWCQIAGVLTFFVTLFFWHDISRLFGGHGQTVFLDKTCVHQTDDARKKKGIEHLASFIYYSWSVVIVYSDVYLQKLWTVYEIASFLLLHPDGVLHIRPVLMPKCMLGGVVVAMLYNLSWAVMHTSVVQDMLPVSSLIADIALSLIVAGPASFALNVINYRMASEFVKISERVHAFRISEAKCFSEADREVVQRNIVGFMKMQCHIGHDASDEEAFEQFELLVRTEVPRRCAASFGRASFPYHMLACVALPYLLQQIDEWGAFLVDPDESLADFCIDFTRKVTTGAAVMPAAASLSLTLGQHLIRKKRTGPATTVFIMFAFHFSCTYGGFALLKILAMMAKTGSTLALVALTTAILASVFVAAWLWWPAPYKVHRRRWKAP